MYTFRSSLCVSSDLPDFNPATLNEMILYYRLMTKWSGLGDSTELSRMGLSHLPCQWALPDLTCGPKDMKTAWSASQDSPDNLR
jgi:hypothetical protein